MYEVLRHVENLKNLTYKTFRKMDLLNALLDPSQNRRIMGSHWRIGLKPEDATSRHYKRISVVPDSDDSIAQAALLTIRPSEGRKEWIS